VEKQIFPILEFDASRSAKIEPSYIIKPKDVPPYCVINYFGDVIEKRLTEGQLTKVAQLFSATVTLPVYITKHNDQPVGIIQGYVGSAGAAAQLEELIALGFNRFIACGAAGTLQKGISLGGLIVPNAAIRDEGTSYHYIPPSREARCDHAVWRPSPLVFVSVTSRMSWVRLGQPTLSTEKRKKRSPYADRKVACVWRWKPQPISPSPSLEMWLLVKSYTEETTLAA